MTKKEDTKPAVRKEFVDYRNVDCAVKGALNLLKNSGSYDNLTDFRREKVELKRALNNVFSADIGLDSNTERSKILKSHIVKTVVEQFVRGTNLPIFDIESTTRSRASFEQKTKSSIVKSLLEWFIRVTGFEDVYNDSLEDLYSYGDNYITPFVREIKTKDGEKDEDRVFPSVEDVLGEDIMIDPNASYVTSEAYSKQAQYTAVTKTYAERNLVSRFGKWILKEAQEGWMVDDSRFPQNETNDQVSKLYEVIEIQDKSSEKELVLVGANAFPVIRNIEDPKDECCGEEDCQCECLTGEELKKKVNLSPETSKNITWEDKYKYRDSFGEAILTMSNSYCYFDPDSPRNRGIANKLAVPQVMHEIVENLKADNMVKRLDQIAFISGGNKDKNERNFAEYRQRRLTNRHAILYLSASLNDRNLPTPGVFKFEGLTAQEGEQISRDVLDFAKNAVGVSPQRQELQKNIGVGQSEILQEEKTDAIESVTEGNLSNYKAQMKMFLSFCIGHEGFGLKDVLIDFVKFDENTPDGNDNATISITEAVKKIKDFEFDVIIDKSSLVKKSRFVEIQKLTQVLGSLPANAAPGAFTKIFMKLSKELGVDLTEDDFIGLEQATASGGASQFQGGGGGGSPGGGSPGGEEQPPTQEELTPELQL